MGAIMKQLDMTITLSAQVRRDGLIGKVQSYIETHPWKECGEIAEALGEWPSRVSNCLNRLKLEGNAQQRKGYGRSSKSLWASTSETGREAREAALVALEPQHKENVEVQSIERFSKAVRMSYRRVAFDSRGIGLARLFNVERIEA
jgi:hypothetical protein